VHRYRYIYL